MRLRLGGTHDWRDRGKSGEESVGEEEDIGNGERGLCACNLHSAAIPTRRWSTTANIPYRNFAARERLSLSTLHRPSIRGQRNSHPVAMNHQALRALPRASFGPTASLRAFPAEITRLYATQGNLGDGLKPKRRNVTVLSDDGRYTWGELSGKEKVARATQQSFNFVIVIAGVVLTVRPRLHPHRSWP